MIEDLELETWREQWRTTAGPRTDFQQGLQTKIKRQNLRHVMGNVVAALAFVAALIFSVWAVRQDPSPLRIGWAVGIWLLVSVCAGYRLRLQRGTWRSETQSTRAFVELWHRRVMAKLRLIRVAFYLVPAWIVFCAALAAANWSALRPDIQAHPADWWKLLGTVFLMVLATLCWLAWQRRRKLAELDEVRTLFKEMRD
jgi:hypothetical protein